MANRFIEPRKTGPEAERTTPAGAYEFGASDNEIFIGVSKSMRIVGILSLLFGVLVTVRGVFTGASLMGFLTVGQGVALMAIGGWLAGASGSLHDVATTTGSDISHLMMALRKLRSVYTLQAWLMCIACAFVAITIAMTMKSH